MRIPVNIRKLSKNTEEGAGTARVGVSRVSCAVLFDRNRVSKVERVKFQQPEQGASVSSPFRGDFFVGSRHPRRQGE